MSPPPAPFVKSVCFWLEKPQPGFDPVHHLPMPIELIPKQPDTAAVLVGGACRRSADPAEVDLTFMSTIPWPDLDYEKAGALQMSYCIWTTEGYQHVWEISKLSRTRKGYDKTLQLQELGRVLAQSCLGNDGVPPMCICEDFHGSFLLITLAFLGLVDGSALHSAHFFNNVSYTPKLLIPMWEYRTLVWKGYNVFNSGCTKHETKSWVDTGLRKGERFMKIFSFFVSCSSGVAGGPFFFGGGGGEDGPARFPVPFPFQAAFGPGFPCRPLRLSPSPGKFCPLCSPPCGLGGLYQVGGWLILVAPVAANGPPVPAVPP